MVKNIFLNLDKDLKAIVRKVGREADAQGLSVYLVGGVVRDILLKKKNVDLDFVVEGDAVSLARNIQKLLKGKLVVYKTFGTATIILSNLWRIDFASARKEKYPCPGALPVVQSGDLTSDLFRRDFTINAMALCVNKNGFGHLIDQYNGLKDLKQKKIRILHEKSFIDDPTRIIRAIRYEQRFSFRMENKTRHLIQEAIDKKAIHTVKPPRFFEEFKKTFNEPDPFRCLKRLNHFKGYSFLGFRKKISLAAVGKIYQRMPALAKNGYHPNTYAAWLILFIALLDGISSSRVKKILSKFHFTKGERKSILQSLQASAIEKLLSAPRAKRSQIYQVLYDLEDTVVIYLRLKTSTKDVRQRIDQYWFRDRHMKTILTGKDLQQMGGKSGKKMGQILKEILCQKVDGTIRTKREEKQLAKQLITV